MLKYLIKIFFQKRKTAYVFSLFSIIAIASFNLLSPNTTSSQSATYVEGGILTSTNFLPVLGSSMINSFTYDASTIPAGTSIKVQFSYDTVNWYNSTGTLDVWTTLSSGENTIDLSNLGWKKTVFYYRFLFNSDGTETPVINSVILAFTEFNGTFYTYTSSGTLTSINFLPADGVSSINSFGYTISSLPPSTGVTIQFSQDSNSWYSSTGVLDASDTLSAGTNSVNLAGLGWTGALYYKTTLTTSNEDNTPIVSAVSLSYTSNNYYWVGGAGGNWNDGSNWSATSGGTGGIGVPTVSDNAIFDSGDTDSVVIDTNINIGNIKLNSGYTGVITQSTSSVITTSGTTTLNAGTLTLSGENNMSGSIVLNAGTLNINNAGAIGTSTLAIIGGTIDNTSDSPVIISTGNLKNWNGNFSFGGTENLSLGNGTTTLGATTTIATNGTDKILTINGTVGGGYGLIKSGTGRLSLTGSNTYSGGMTLAAGTLDINNAGALGTGSYTQTDGALNVYGNIIIPGYLAISSGTIDFYSGSVLGGVVDISAGHAVDFNDTSYSIGTINGNARFSYATSGIVTLSNNMSWGTVTGTSKGISDNISINHWIFNDNSYNNATTTVASSSTMSFYASSTNRGFISVASGGVVDFYDESSNNERISVASGGIVNFHNNSFNNNGTVTVATGGAVKFYDNSYNLDGDATVSVGGIFDFYNLSYNDGLVSGNVTFHDDFSEERGTTTGSTTRQYNSNATTTRNFTTDGERNDWIIVAQGVLVDISNAIYSIVTNIFKAFSNGIFFFGSNSEGGPVIPQISIASPFAGENSVVGTSTVLVGTTTTKWLPSVDWGNSNVCEYRIDNDEYQTVDCDNNGSDILRPTAAEHTLYIKGTDAKGNLSEKSMSFIYDNTVPIYTLCGTDFLDEATRPYYYLASNVTGDCRVTVNTELRGAYATGTAGFTLTGNVNANATTSGGNGFDIDINSITISGSISSNGVSNSSGKGGSGGSINIATSTTGSITANGATSTTDGGNGGRVEIVNSLGNPTSSSVEARGGDSTSCGDGGNAGFISLLNSSYGGNITNAAGSGANTGCVSESHSSGSYVQTRPDIVGIYVPPVVYSPSSSASNNGASAGGASGGSFLYSNLNGKDLGKLNLKNIPKVDLFNNGNIGVSKFVNPLADLIMLKPLPLGGFPVMFKVSISNNINKFLSMSLPKSLANLSNSVPSIKKELNKAGVVNGYDLYSMKESPVNTPTLGELAKDKTAQPNNLIFTTVDGKERQTKLSIDGKENIYQIITVEPYASVAINVKNTDKTQLVKTTFDNKTIKSVKDKNNIVKLSLIAPKEEGSYKLKVGGVVLEVRVKTSETSPAPAQQQVTQEKMGDKKLSPIKKLWSWFSK